MYQVPKLSMNSSKIIIENTITKRKKAVLHFVQREKIIDKYKNGNCPRKTRTRLQAFFLNIKVVSFATNQNRFNIIPVPINKFNFVVVIFIS